MCIIECTLILAARDRCELAGPRAVTLLPLAREPYARREEADPQRHDQRKQGPSSVSSVRTATCLLPVGAIGTVAGRHFLPHVRRLPVPALPRDSQNYTQGVPECHPPSRESKHIGPRASSPSKQPSNSKVPPQRHASTAHVISVCHFALKTNTTRIAGGLHKGAVTLC